MTKKKEHPQGSWIDEEFAGVKLGDARMEKRLKRIARSFESCLQGSVLEASGDWAGAKAAYRFFASELEPETLLAGHRQQTIERLGRHEVVLALQDTTVLNFTAHRATEGMGSIGANCQGNTGFFCHSTLVVEVEGQALGLLKAETYVRRAPRGKRKRGPQAPGCESQRWLRSLDACQEAAQAQSGTRIVNIGDREADFYEFAAHAHEATPQVNFVIRACYDRQGEPGAASLFEEVGQQNSGGEIIIEVPRTATSKARQSKLEIRFCPVRLQVPAHWPAAARAAAPPLALWLVEAREPQSASREEAICWRLLSDLPVENFAQAVEKVQWYRQRWNIEVFHKVLKSGCAVERRQLETRARLERALMLDLVMAWRVLSLLGLGRAHPQLSAAVVLEEYQWKALHCFEQQTRTAPTQPPSLGQAMRSIAKLGGFAGRKSDGYPGPAVLWRGLRRLDDIAASYLAFGQKTCG